MVKSFAKDELFTHVLQCKFWRMREEGGWFVLLGLLFTHITV